MGLLANARTPEAPIEDEEAFRVALLNMQYDLRKADFPLVIVLHGDDRPAVEHMLHRIGAWLDERYIRIESFAPPTDEEAERPRFWRYWRALPRRGQIGLVVGGWAAGTCRQRVVGNGGKRNFLKNVAHDERFERCLAADGALVLKFWFDLPKKAHKERLEAAKEAPHRLWFVDERDLEIYETYDEAIEVADRYLALTNSDVVPWRVVDSSDRETAAVFLLQTLLAEATARLDRPASPSVPDAGAPKMANLRMRQLASDGPPLAGVDLSLALDKEDYDRQKAEQTLRLKTLSMAATEARLTSVLVFEGWDAAGKGGVIRRLKLPLDPRNSRVVPISAPTEEELSHHYLWRFWRQLPRAGSTIIFDRSWYGRVLVERVEGFASEPEWQRAYDEICDLEEQFVEHGYLLLKFFLHIDPDEQARRFEARELTPYKKYKITEEDYRNRDRWSAYEQAVNDMVLRTDTKRAPWALVPANDKRWARVQVMKAFADALEARLS